MIKSLRTQYILLLLAAATVGLYCSSLIEITLKPAVVNIDDRSLMLSLLNHKLTFHDIFWVQNSGKYFRPFLGLTFLMDQRLWGETIFGFRFTNVVFHTCNTLLVYSIGRTLLKTQLYRTEASFGAALLFAVHPIAVESVAWISGRTDLLVTFWSLLAFYFYLLANNKNALYTLPLSVVCALAAALSKETGIMVFILIIGWEIYYGKYFNFPKMKFALFFILLFLSSGILYFALRFNALASRDMSMEMIRSRILSGEVLFSVKMILASYGFYIKKFIDPFPLQFAIDTINTNLYVLLGTVVILLFGVRMFVKSSVTSFFCFWTLLGLLPSAVVSLTDIAWTPWAERYLYFSLVPLSFIFGILCVELMDRWDGFARKITYTCAAIVILIFAVSSDQRSHVWNDDLLLSHDTFTKSPSFIPAVVSYASSLREKGMEDEAEQQLHKAELLPGAKHQVFYNLGLINMNTGDSERARQYFLAALTEARNDKKLVLMGPYFKKTILVSISDLEMAESRLCTDEKIKLWHYEQAIECLVEANREDPSDAFFLYNIAKLYLTIGNKAEAIKYLEEFIKQWDNDFYRQAAERLLKKIHTPDLSLHSMYQVA